MAVSSTWLECLVSVRFDLDIGPVVEYVSPPGALSEAGKAALIHSAFPDCNPNSAHNFIFSFSMKDCTRAAEERAGDVIADPTQGSTMARIYGAAFYRQKRDAHVPRGYVQQVLVLLSRLPYLVVHELILRVVAPRFSQCCALSPDTELTPIASALAPRPAIYFKMDPSFTPDHYTQPQVLDEALLEVSEWPSPHPGLRYGVSLLHQSLDFVTPTHGSRAPRGSVMRSAARRPPMRDDERVRAVRRDAKDPGDRLATPQPPLLPLSSLGGGGGVASSSSASNLAGLVGALMHNATGGGDSGGVSGASGGRCGNGTMGSPAAGGGSTSGSIGGSGGAAGGGGGGFPSGAPLSVVSAVAAATSVLSAHSMSGTGGDGGTAEELLPVYGILGDHVHYLTRLWELLICHQPLLIMSTTPSTAAAVANAVTALVMPLHFNGSCRPYFTVQHEEFGRLSRMGAALPFPETESIVIAGTNPFFLRNFAGWPNLLVVVDKYAAGVARPPVSAAASLAASYMPPDGSDTETTTTTAAVTAANTNGGGAGSSHDNSRSNRWNGSSSGGGGANNAASTNPHNSDDPYNECSNVDYSSSPRLAHGGPSPPPQAWGVSQSAGAAASGGGGGGGLGSSSAPAVSSVAAAAASVMERLSNAVFWEGGGDAGSTSAAAAGVTADGSEAARRKYPHHAGLTLPASPAMAAATGAGTAIPTASLPFPTVVSGSGGADRGGGSSGEGQSPLSGGGHGHFLSAFTDGHRHHHHHHHRSSSSNININASSSGNNSITTRTFWEGDDDVDSPTPVLPFGCSLPRAGAHSKPRAEQLTDDANHSKWDPAAVASATSMNASARTAAAGAGAGETLIQLQQVHFGSSVGSSDGKTTSSRGGSPPPPPPTTAAATAANNGHSATTTDGPSESWLNPLEEKAPKEKRPEAHPGSGNSQQHVDPQLSVSGRSGASAAVSPATSPRTFTSHNASHANNNNNVSNTHPFSGSTSLLAPSAASDAYAASGSPVSATFNEQFFRVPQYQQLVSRAGMAAQRSIHKRNAAASRAKLQHKLANYFDSSFAFVLDHAEHTALLMRRLETVSRLSTEAQATAVGLCADDWFGQGGSSSAAKGGGGGAHAGPSAGGRFATASTTSKNINVSAEKGSTPPAASPRTPAPALASPTSSTVVPPSFGFGHQPWHKSQASPGVDGAANGSFSGYNNSTTTAVSAATPTTAVSHPNVSDSSRVSNGRSTETAYSVQDTQAVLFRQYTVADSIIHKYFCSLTREFLGPVVAYFAVATAGVSPFALCDHHTAAGIMTPDGFLHFFQQHHHELAPPMYARQQSYKTYKTVYERFARGSLFLAARQQWVDSVVRAALASFDAEEWTRRVPDEGARIDLFISLHGAVRRELEETLDPDVGLVRLATAALCGMAVCISSPLREHLMNKVVDLKL